MNAGALIVFCQRLLNPGQREVFLRLDNPGLHDASVFKVWLAARQHEIGVFYLPTCSLELHADEYPSGDLKSGVTENNRQ